MKQKYEFPPDMPYDIKWIFPRQERPNALFRAASRLTIGMVGLISRIVIGNGKGSPIHTFLLLAFLYVNKCPSRLILIVCGAVVALLCKVYSLSDNIHLHPVLLNKTRIHNKQRLEDLVENRPKDHPLLTISNHHSCFDDPGIFGCLKLRNVGSSKRIRWSMAAYDICFTNRLHATFFMFGKCIPVIRGGGVYQPAVDLCIQKLKLGEWVHVFPEGKVNMEKEYLRLKWGVGRILYETYPIIPTIIPIWHEGMDKLLPNYPPYYFRLNNKLTFNFGNPIDIKDVMKHIFDNNLDEVTARRLITDKLQEELNILRAETEQLHKKS